MTQIRQSTQKSVNALANGRANGYANSSPNGHTNGHVKTTQLSSSSQKTDRLRWRLLDESGRHTWHYLKTDEELAAWPQTTADKYYMGLPTVSLN